MIARLIVGGLHILFAYLVIAFTVWEWNIGLWITSTKTTFLIMSFLLLRLLYLSDKRNENRKRLKQEIDKVREELEKVGNEEQTKMARKGENH